MSVSNTRKVLGAVAVLALAGAVAGCSGSGGGTSAQAYPPPSYGSSTPPESYGSTMPPGPPAAAMGAMSFAPTVALHLRAGPSDNAPILATLPPGMPVQPEGGRVGNWWQVQTGYGSGWVYSRYLAPG